MDSVSNGRISVSDFSILTLFVMFLCSCADFGVSLYIRSKALIKTTRARIEVVRRRAEAQQRFLKEDLVKLLSNGLDINAYGKVMHYTPFLVIFLISILLIDIYLIFSSCDYKH